MNIVALTVLQTTPRTRTLLEELGAANMNGTPTVIDLSSPSHEDACRRVEQQLDWLDEQGGEDVAPWHRLLRAKRLS